MSAFQAIRAIDYTVIFVRDMAAMRRFYEGILGFALHRELSPDWLEYRVGDNTLALARPRRTAADAPTPAGSASLQLAFKVAVAEVDQCADELARQHVELLGARDVVHLPKRPGEPDCTLADTAKIRHLIGWEPKVPIEDGVGIMLRHIDDWREAPVWTPEAIAGATREWFEHLGRQRPAA